jgi:hypothetical protein
VRRLRTLLSETKVDLEEARRLHGEGSIEVDRLTQSYKDLTEDLAAAVAKQKEFKAQLDALKVAGIGPWQTTVTDERPTPDPGGLGGISKEISEALAKLQVMRDEMTQFPESVSRAFSVIPSEFDGVHAEIDRLTEKYKSHADQVRQLQAMKQDLWRQEQDTIMDTAQMFGSTLTALFQKSKSAAIGEALINTAVGITRALRDVPWPYNWVQAALVATSGAAQIASIRSASQSGAGSTAPATGGGSSAGGSAGPAVSRSLTIQGVDRASWYSGDVVANLVESINDFVKDGGTLISTRHVAV